MPRKTKAENIVAEVDALYAKARPGKWRYNPAYPMFIGSRHVVERPSGAIHFGITGPRKWKDGKILEDDKQDAAEAELTALLFNRWPEIRRALRRKKK